MFSVTAAQATEMVTQLGTAGTALIGSLVVLAGFFLGRAALAWVLSTIRRALHF